MFASVCHLGMGGFWVWVYVCIFVSLRYGFWGGVGVSINQSIFYFMSVHIEVILDKNKNI